MIVSRDHQPGGRGALGALVSDWWNSPISNQLFMATNNAGIGDASLAVVTYELLLVSSTLWSLTVATCHALNAIGHSGCQEEGLLSPDMSMVCQDHPVQTSVRRLVQGTCKGDSYKRLTQKTHTEDSYKTVPHDECCKKCLRSSESNHWNDWIMLMLVNANEAIKFWSELFRISSRSSTIELRTSNS